MRLSPCNAGKAFEWQYLWAILERFGLGRGFNDMIHVLYANPTAMIHKQLAFEPLSHLSWDLTGMWPLAKFVYSLVRTTSCAFERELGHCSYSD